MSPQKSLPSTEVGRYFLIRGVLLCTSIGKMPRAYNDRFALAAEDAAANRYKMQGDGRNIGDLDLIIWPSRQTFWMVPPDRPSSCGRKFASGCTQRKSAAAYGFDHTGVHFFFSFPND